MAQINTISCRYVYNGLVPPDYLVFGVLDNCPNAIDSDINTAIASYNKRYDNYAFYIPDGKSVKKFRVWDNAGASNITSYGALQVWYSDDWDNWVKVTPPNPTASARVADSGQYYWDLELDAAITGHRYIRIHVNTLFSTDYPGYDAAVYFSELQLFESTATSGSGSITSDAYILPYSDADPTYFAIEGSSSTVGTLELNTEMYSVDLKHVCNHILASGKYTLESCPRCLGTGYYYDVLFNELGLVETTTEIEKLCQSLEKITLTDYNPFHPGYGAALLTRLGQVPVEDLKPIIERDLVNAVNLLKDIQAKEATYVTFTAAERIVGIGKITIEASGVTELTFIVDVVTASGESAILSGIINI